MKRTLIAAAVALVVGGTAATASQAISLPAWLQRPNASAQQAGADAKGALPAQPLAAAQPAVPNYRAIVQAEGPAVVGVTVAGLRPASEDDGPSIEQDPFFQFFRGMPGFRMPHRGATPFRGQGSGFIVSEDGLVLTNAHVVRDAREVTVKLADRREFSAKVLGVDAATDVAVLKIDAKGLPTVRLGDPSVAQVGDYVLAIGAPFGFEQSATQGIVSAKGRSLPGDSGVPFIQTDAAVNPGNSGGPLFDASGQVIGINAQIYSSSGGFQGLAFAIPIDLALHVKDQIVAHGRVEHARLGVSMQGLSAQLAESFGMKSPDGALVSSVVPDSAAAKAGLKPGDVITALDGKPVRTIGDLASRIGLARPGDRMKIAYWRDGAAQEVQVTLGRAETEKRASTDQPGEPVLGIAVRPLARGELREAGVEHGLLVEQADGPARLAGIAPGDVLLALNGRPLSSVEQVREALSKHPKHIALLVLRDGQQMFVPVKLG